MVQITSIEQLRDKTGFPNPLSEQKIYDHLFAEAKQFIAASPLLLLASNNKAGHCTVSPKGDAAGFVFVEDDKTLLLPDRPGNKLAHGLTNIIETGEVGLIFLIPGMDETLRVNGTCTIHDDADLCEKLSARGRPAELVLKVKVRDCFLHCAKAFIRSQSWQPEAWPEPFRISFGDVIARNAQGNNDDKKALSDIIEQVVAEDYKDGL